MDTLHRKKALASRGLNDNFKCVECGQRKSYVIDSRPNKSGVIIRRRRECLNCQHRFTTLEIQADSLEDIPQMILDLTLKVMSFQIKQSVSKSLKAVFYAETMDLQRKEKE